MIEALVFGCDMDWDLAWGLEAEEDYLQEIVENYDINTHLVIPSGTYEGRRIAGALYFIRLHGEVQEVTSEGVRHRLAHAVPTSPGVPPAHERKRTLSKRQVETYVRQYEIEPVEAAAGEDKKMIRYLQRLLYSGDAQLRQRAAETLGRVCAVIGDKDPGIVSKLLQGLFYSIVDTAAFPWGAFEAIGEIIGQRPDLFGGYTPQLYQFLADQTRKAQAIQALGRIARSSPSVLRKHTLHFFAFLDDPDPEVRGYTARLMGNLGAFEAKKDLERLLGETHEIETYREGFILRKSVGQMASEALKKISSQSACIMSPPKIKRKIIS